MTVSFGFVPPRLSSRRVRVYGVLLIVPDEVRDRLGADAGGLHIWSTDISRLGIASGRAVPSFMSATILF